MITLDQFKSWLLGVEDMQPENWTPSNTQWKKIRAKIDEIGHSQSATMQPNVYYPRDTTQYQVVPLMEPAPAPSMIPNFNMMRAPTNRFESDIVQPTVVSPVDPSHQVPAFQNDTFSSQFV